MTVTYDDIAKEAGDGVPSDKLEQLRNLADEYASAQEALKKAEEALTKRKQHLTQLGEHTIPEIMTELGLVDFTTSTGVKLSLKEKIRVGQLSSSSKPEAMKWLEDNGHGGLIKRTFTILFGREDQAWARRFAADLKRRKRPLDSRQEATVNAQTLASFLTNMREQGEDIPLDKFGAFEQKFIKLEDKKKKDK